MVARMTDFTKQEQRELLKLELKKALHYLSLSDKKETADSWYKTDYLANLATLDQTLHAIRKDSIALMKLERGL